MDTHKKQARRSAMLHNTREMIRLTADPDYKLNLVKMEDRLPDDHPDKKDGKKVGWTMAEKGL